jgi:hypothetical protein
MGELSNHAYQKAHQGNRSSGEIVFALGSGLYVPSLGSGH